VRRFAPISGVLMALALAASPTLAPSAVADDTNVAPTVTVHAVSTSVDEPMPASVLATFTDPESATETYTCAVDFGDGTGPVAVPVSGLVCAGPDHHYAATNTYTVTVTVTDNGGASGSATVSIHYHNWAPFLGQVSVLGSPNIGQPMQATVGFSDQSSALGGKPLETYSCSFDWGDGTGAQPGTVDMTRYSCASVHTYSSAGTYTITPVVTDSGGASSSSGQQTYVLTIYQNAPVVTSPANATVAAAPGMPPTTFSLGSFTDPSGASAGPWQWTAVWADGTSTVGTASTPGALSASHAYTAVGSYQVLVRVTNAAGYSGFGSFVVTATDGIAVVFPTSSQVVT
jgi:hypothetical protein